MNNIYLAINEVALGQGHMQIVYENGNGFFAELEVQAPDDFGREGDWKFLGRDETRSHFDNTPGVMRTNDPEEPDQYSIEDHDEYDIVEIQPIQGQSDAQLWELFVNIHKSLAISGSELDYDTIGDAQNSNSYVFSMFWAVGIDLSTYRDPILEGNSSFGGVKSTPGGDRNVFINGENGGDDDILKINMNVVGTEGNDFIRFGLGADIIAGGIGEDHLHGGAGNDFLFGRNQTGAELSLGETPSLNAAFLQSLNQMQFNPNNNNTVSEQSYIDDAADFLFGGEGNDAYFVGISTNVNASLLPPKHS